MMDVANHEQVAAAVRTPIQHRRTTTKDTRRRPEHAYREFSAEIFLQICSVMGRNKYRCIVVVVWLSEYWEGWVSKDKRKRKKGRLPRKESMITRRMMADKYGYNESTINLALNDLLNHELISVAREYVYNVKEGESLGRGYTLPWMTEKGKRKVVIFTGLLVSERFLALDVTSQALLVLLHVYHRRGSNHVVIEHQNLIALGINRNIITGHINKLRHAGLIEYIESDTYKFNWCDDRGKYKSGWNKKNDAHNSDRTCT